MVTPNPASKLVRLSSVIDQLEEALLPTLRLTLPVMGYKATLDFVRYLVAGVVRELYRGGLTQEQLARDLRTTRVTIGSLISNRDLRRRPDVDDCQPSVMILIVAVLGSEGTALTYEEICARVSPLLPGVEHRALNQWVWDALNSALRENLVSMVQTNGRAAFCLGENGPHIKMKADHAMIVELAARRLQQHIAFQRRYDGRPEAGPRITKIFRFELTRKTAYDLLVDLNEYTLRKMTEYEALARQELAAAAAAGGAEAGKACGPLEFELIWVGSKASLSVADDGSEGRG